MGMGSPDMIWWFGEWLKYLFFYSTLSDEWRYDDRRAALSFFPHNKSS